MEEEPDEFDKELFAEEPPKKGKKKAVNPAQTSKTVPENQEKEGSEPDYATEQREIAEDQEKEKALFFQKMIEKVNVIAEVQTKMSLDLDLTKRRISDTLEAQKEIEKRVLLIKEEQLDAFSQLLNQIGDRLEEANRTYKEINIIFSDYEKNWGEIRKYYGMGVNRDAYDYSVETIFKLEKKFSQLLPALSELRDKGAKLIEILMKERETQEEE